MKADRGVVAEVGLRDVGEGGHQGYIFEARCSKDGAKLLSIIDTGITVVRPMIKAVVTRVPRLFMVQMEFFSMSSTSICRGRIYPSIHLCFRRCLAVRLLPG